MGVDTISWFYVERKVQGNNGEDYLVQMNANPLVSIIIPCYQQAQYLSQAMESALGQTYQNVEVIVVNDGSRDDTEKVAKSYGDKVVYLCQQNKGLASARNAGYAASKGVYIQFLDADDVIYREKLQKQLRMLEADPAMLVAISDYIKRRMADGGIQGIFRIKPSDDLLSDIACQWEKSYSIPIHAGLFRRSAWIGEAPFDEQLRAREDWAMWVGLAVQTGSFGYVDEVLCEYRIHDEGMCRNWKGMCTSLIDAAEVIRPKVPLNYLAEFDDHVTWLINKYLRNHLLVGAKDYSALYYQCHDDYCKCRKRFEVRMVERIKGMWVYRAIRARVGRPTARGI